MYIITLFYTAMCGNAIASKLADLHSHYHTSLTLHIFHSMISTLQCNEIFVKRC